VLGGAFRHDPSGLIVCAVRPAMVGYIRYTVASHHQQ